MRYAQRNVLFRFRRAMAVASAVMFAWPMATALRADDWDASRASDRDLIVHEWGTFTTFAGSDGVHLDYRPFANVESDLPNFVLHRSSTTAFKKNLWSRVRMETPITYFYTKRERSITAAVEFPAGLLTEYYPCPSWSFLNSM